MGWRIAAAVLAVLIVVVYAGLSGRWVATGGEWYEALPKPWWQPPPFVFGLIWPYNFLVLVIAGIWLALNSAPVKIMAFLGFITISVVFALTWAYQFYVPHNLLLAAIALSIAALLTVPAVALVFTERIWLGVLLIPYQIWLFLAASLSWGYQAQSGN